MALVKCKECGGSISEHAKTCPHCGETFPHSSGVWREVDQFLSQHGWWFVIVVVFIFFWILVQLFPALRAPPQDLQRKPVDNITDGLPTTEELERRKSSGP